MPTKKVSKKAKPKAKKMPVQVARERMLKLATQILDQLGDEVKPECYPKWDGAPGSDVMDPANWTCVAVGGGTCTGGVECKFLFKEGTKKDGTKYKFPSCCKD